VLDVRGQVERVRNAMFVKITEHVNSLEDVVNFLQKFPKDCPVCDIELEHDGAWQASITLYSSQIETIECGDHYPSTTPYPLDLLVGLHSHD